MIVRIALFTLMAVFVAACEGGGSSAPDRLKRPLFTDADHLNSDRTYILDGGRSAVFVWDGSANRTFNTGRTPHPKGFIGIPIGTQSFLSKQDVIYRGFAVTPTGSAMAALYSYGFSDRVAQLRVLPLVPFPVDPASARIFTLQPDVVGPFVTPEGRFLVVEPIDSNSAVWRTFPEPVSSLAGPNVRSLKWNDEGTMVYAADSVNERIHVFEWPSFTPVTSVTVDGFPIDLDVSPVTDAVAVITSAELIRYGATPTMAVDERTALADVPLSVLFSRRQGGALIAVLNQNTTVGFFEEETLCQIDVASPGFEVQNLVFTDTGEFSDAQIGAVSAVGCVGKVPDQLWTITYEGSVSLGNTEVLAQNAVTDVAWEKRDVRVGDPIFIDGFATEVTSITDRILYFSPATTDLDIGSTVTYQTLAGGAWTVRGALSGYIGRAEEGDVFSNLLKFELQTGPREPTRGDSFSFQSRGNVTSISLGGVPSSLSEDPFGRFLAAVPDNGYVRAIEARREDSRWLIETLYTIP